MNMTGEAGSITTARHAFWGKKIDRDFDIPDTDQIQGTQMNLCKEESQIKTLSLSDDGSPLPVLNIFETSSNLGSKTIVGKKTLIFVQDSHYSFNGSLSKMWGNFLLQKAQHKLSDVISEDDFIVITTQEVNQKLNHLKRMVTDGEIQTLLIFNDQGLEKPGNLGNIFLDIKHQIRLKDVVAGASNVPLTICIMTPWSANASPRQLYELSMKYNDEINQSSTNFLYPVATYTAKDNFCFEMATMFRVLVGQLSNYNRLSEVVQLCQLDLHERLTDDSLLENRKICAVSSSSFLYIPSSEFGRENLPNHKFESPSDDLPSSRIKKLDAVMEKTKKKGKIESSVSGIEAVSMNLSGSAIALLNDNLHLRSNYCKQLFALSLSVLHSCRKKTESNDVLSKEKINQLWNEYLSTNSIPFSFALWRASETSTMAPRNIMKAIKKALYHVDSPEWKISDAVIRAISDEYTIFDNPFSEFTTKLEKIRTILPGTEEYTELLTSGGVNFYFGIFLTRKGFLALEDMAKLHAIEAQYRSGADVLGVWSQQRKTMFFEGGEPTYISWEKLSTRLEKLCELTNSILADEEYPFGDVLDQRRDDEIPVSNWVEMAKSMWEEME